MSGGQARGDDPDDGLGGASILKKNLWHCLGAFRAGGSAIDWVMRAEALSFRHAVELLQVDYQPLTSDSGSVAGMRPPGAPAYRPSQGIKHSTVRKLPAPHSVDRVLAQYATTLPGTKPHNPISKEENRCQKHR